MLETTDEDIARRVQKGEKEEFGALVERYQPKMARYARKFLFVGDDVADLVQEVFIKAFVNIQSFDASMRFSPWLYRIAHNLFINTIRNRTKERRNFSLFDVDVLFPHPIAKETADEHANHEEVKKMLDGSLGTLDAKYREPLILFYFEELDYKEIAQVLQIPLSTVGIRILRGKALLKKKIIE